MTRRATVGALLATIVVLVLPAAVGARPRGHASPTPPRHGPAATAHNHRSALRGVVPDIPTGAHLRPRVRIANLPYGGGPVLHWNRTHLIFWEPSGSGLSFEAGYVALISTFMVDVAADSRKPTNVYALSGQYHDSNGPAAYNSSYGGAVLATDPLPANHCREPLVGGPGWLDCLDNQQMVDQIQSVIRTRHLPATSNDIYFLILPAGLGSCEAGGPEDCALGGATDGSYCGYHSSTDSGLPYAVIPYNAVAGHCQSGNPRPNASTADPAVSTLSHEHNEIVTDPFGGAWIDGSFSEDGDLCISAFGPPLGGSGSSAYNEVIHDHLYYLQEEWSNEDGSCQPHDEADRISFTAPARAHSRTATDFTAHAGDPDGSIISYNWFFGDHGTSRQRHASHTFKKPGSYRVVLRTTDSAGNWVFFAATVKVVRGAARDTRHRNPKRSDH